MQAETDTRETVTIEPFNFNNGKTLFEVKLHGELLQGGFDSPEDAGFWANAQGYKIFEKVVDTIPAQC